MTATVGTSVHAQQIEKILKLAVENAATEVRLGAGSPPRVLIDGQWRPIGKNPLTADDVQALASAVLPPGGDPAKFSFATSLGACEAALLDVQGTKVLVLKPGGSAPAAGGAPIELDIQTDDAAEEEGATAGGGDAYAMPQAAVATASDWGEIILPMTPPLVLAAPVRIGLRPSCSAVAFCKPPKRTLLEVSEPVRNTPSQPRNGAINGNQ